MTTRDILNLIFLPGFSTAEQVTNVSGRGVGHGRRQDPDRGASAASVDVTSTRRARHHVPADDPAHARDHPRADDRLRRPAATPCRRSACSSWCGCPASTPAAGIELISGAPVYRLRDMLLPLVRLDEQLGLVPAGAGGGRGRRARRLHRRPAGRAAALRARRRRRPRHPGDRRQAARPAPQGPPGVRRGDDPRRRLASSLILDASTLARRANVLATSVGVTTVERRHRHSSRRPRARGRRSAAGAARRSRWRWSPGSRRSRRPRSNASAAARWSSTAATSCRWSGSRACSASTASRRRRGRAGRGLHARRAQRRLRGRAHPRHRHRARRHPQRHRRPGSRRQRRRRRQGRRAARRGQRCPGRRPPLLPRRRAPGGADAEEALA